MPRRRVYWLAAPRGTAHGETYVRAASRLRRRIDRLPPLPAAHYRDRKTQQSQCYPVEGASAQSTGHVPERPTRNETQRSSSFDPIDRPDEMAEAGERRIGVAMDFSASSKKALRWAADNLLRKGDTLVLLHIRHHGRDEAKNALWSHSGSPLIPLVELMESAVRQRYDMPSDDEMFDMLNTVCRDKELSVVLQMYWGDPREKVCEAVGELKLESLVMGSRGLGQIQRILLGSVTNYVLSNASCPVTVVKGK